MGGVGYNVLNGTDRAPREGMMTITTVPYVDWTTADLTTVYDRQHEGTSYPHQQYMRGYTTGREFDRVHISPTGSWGASSAMRSMMAYETLGLHACTKQLMQGLLDSGVAIYTYDVEFNLVLIREATEPVEMRP